MELLYYGLAGIAFLITMGAQAFIKSAYSKYSEVATGKKMTGAEVARFILDKNGLKHVDVVKVEGFLSDHYDPAAKVVRLSDTNYSHASVAGVSVAAHECGHAIQDKTSYTFLRIRSKMVPIVNLSSTAGYFAIAIGVAASMLGLIWIGIGLELVILLFQIVTLPVEFDASRRALKELEKYELLNKDEHGNGKTVLTAAALTYVAAVASALTQILQLILVYGRRNRRQR